jgi:hypothetical protein
LLVKPHASLADKATRDAWLIGHPSEITRIVDEATREIHDGRQWRTQNKILGGADSTRDKSLD